MASIDSHINKITGLLNQVSHCNNLVATRDLDDDAKRTMKREAKDIVRDVKDELDQIRDEINEW